MQRPCFLVVDHEYPGSISSRKLVLETAKFNVITAYSSEEAFDVLQRFPAVDAVVLNAHSGDIPCEEMARRVRSISPRIPIVVTSAGSHGDCPPATHHVTSFDPKLLLETLQNLNAAKTAEIVAHEQQLLEDMQ